MGKTFISAIAAACCVAAAGARANEPQTAYRFELTWAGAGYYCYYKSLCNEIEGGGSLPITTSGQTGTFHQVFGGYDFTIVTNPDGANPSLADAIISGTFHDRAIGGYGTSEYAFHADSTDPYAGSYSRSMGTWRVSSAVRRSPRAWPFRSRRMPD